MCDIIVQRSADTIAPSCDRGERHVRTHRPAACGCTIAFAELIGEASDSLLTTGECISASLLKIALEAQGVRATALNAYRLGILSDSSFTQAAIRSVDADPAAWFTGC